MSQMNLSRIQGAMDVKRMGEAIVAGVGAGGSATFFCNLARCGVRRFRIIDPQRIERSNVARQGHDATEIGTPKVKAVAKMIKAINSEAEVTYLVQDFCDLSDGEIDSFLGDANLLCFMTDSFRAQARGNEAALRLNKPALWAGLYRGGTAGEIAFWHPQLAACYRCLMAARYEAQEKATKAGESLDPPSDGATIFDIQFLDAIAGMIAVGLLTRGAKNRFGRLIEELDDRNFIMVTTDSSYRWNGRDIIREQLKVPSDVRTLFAWNAVVRSDETAATEPCPDCRQFRGRTPSVKAHCDNRQTDLVDDILVPGSIH